MKPAARSSRWFAPLVVVAMAAGRFSAGGAEEFLARWFTNATGGTMPYRLLVPRDYAAEAKYPLVVLFHGAGERGTNNQSQLVHGAKLFLEPENRARFRCFVLAPQCPAGQQWVDMPWGADAGTRPDQPSAAMQLALGIMDALPREFSIDPDRLFLVGLSMGGYAVWDCLTRFPERVAAAAPICGGGDEKTVSAAAAKVPVWAFHSVDDAVVPASRTQNMIAAMRAARGQPKCFEYFGLGHNSWDRAFGEPELLPWMFAQRRGQPDSYALRTKAPEVPAVARFPADDEFPGQGPIRKMEWFRKLWIQRRLQWWRERDKDQGAVVFLGDSITQGWGSLAHDFPNLKTANRGISGDVTRGVLYRLKEDVLDLNPKAVVLLIGTNDLEEGAEPDTIAQNVRAILAACRARDQRLPVIVCKVMPAHASKKRPADKIQRINALVDEVVKTDPKFVRCDTWSIFADDQGNAKAGEFPDRLHPNAAGYAKWAAALRPVLERLQMGAP